MYPNWDDPLLPLLAAYHAAVIRSDGLQEKLRRGPGDENTLDRSLLAAEQVIEARAALYRGLIDLGWSPPAQVVDNLRTDIEVLHLPGGF
ncbi:MAG: hypothetical protein LC789_03540 [Actinobacteria bacterium]|nr:hypothetical protein [Actinomycetota bacterium]MCA1722409.1 hypothetical protein [Actinomycetota bacterium]